jgi:Cd2+/Zn2+-exporting ATPase
LDLQTALTEIGFTEYESKVYLALLRENPGNGYQISKISGVPRSMVYETLSRLHGRGVVLETIEGRSTLYRPLPPDVLLDRYEKEHTRLLGSLRDGLEALYNEPAEDRMWSVSGQSAVYAYAVQMLKEAKHEAFLVLNDVDLEVLGAEIAAACERGVAVSSVLTGEGEIECGHSVYHPPLESELQGLTETLLIVVDNAEALVASSKHGMTATITHSPNLVLIVRQFVWMELFTQRVYARLGPELLARLDPEDRSIFESLEQTATDPVG